MNKHQINAMIRYHRVERAKLEEMQQASRSSTVRDSLEKYIQHEQEQLDKLHKMKRGLVLAEHWPAQVKNTEGRE